MPVNHRKISTAPDIGEPNTIMVSDWNANMVGYGSLNLLPLLRKTAHPDGMDFAVSAQEARDGINVYSREEVDNLVLTGGTGVPPGGLQNQVLTKGVGTTTFWSSGLLDLTFQGRDASGIVRPVIWIDSPNLLKISDGSFNIFAQSDITVSHPTVGHRVLEIQTDGGYVPYLRFHRRGVSYWSAGSDGSGFVFSTSAGLDQPKFRIDANGNLFMPQGQWLHGGGRALIAFDGTNTVVGGYVNSVVLTSHAHANSGLYVTGHTRVASLNIAQDNIMQSESGRWIAFDRSSDGEMIYAYNTNDCFNEAAGRTLFHRDVHVHGTTFLTHLNVGGTSVFNGPVTFNGAVGGTIENPIIAAGWLQLYPASFAGYGVHTVEQLSSTQVRLHCVKGSPRGRLIASLTPGPFTGIFGSQGGATYIEVFGPTSDNAACNVIITG